MASLKLVQARSAMSMASKISILVQEATRRVSNCSVNLPWETKAKHINTLMCQMQGSDLGLLKETWVT